MCFVGNEIEPFVHVQSASVYRPPNASYDSSNELLIHLKDVVSAKRFITYGEFNLSDIDWSTFTVNFKLRAIQCLNILLKSECQRRNVQMRICFQQQAILY